MIRKILVLTDGSESSRTALSIATSLASLADAELVGLSIVDSARFSRLVLATAIAENVSGAPVLPEPLPPDEMLRETERAQAEVCELQQEFKAACSASGVDGTFRTEQGDPLELMKQFALTCDLVVAGDAGRRSSAEGQPGAHLSALLQSTTRPVFVTPRDAQGQNTLIIAYDGSPPAERVIAVAAELSVIAQVSDVHLLTVASEEEGERIQASALEYLRGYNLNPRSVIRSGKVEEAILSYANEVDASIIALGCSGMHPLRDRIFGSTAERLLQRSNAALLLIA